MRRLDRFRLWLSSALVMVAFCSQAGAQPTLEIVPASPRYQEPVYARITPDRMSGFYICGASVSMSGAVMSIAPEWVIEIGAGASFIHDFMWRAPCRGPIRCPLDGPPDH